jgi:hypothetical protein
MVKNLDILKDFKNSAEVKNEGGVIVLAFAKPIFVAEKESNTDFEFRIPTLEDLEFAMDASKDEKEEDMKNLIQSYYLISSQFSPKIAPTDMPKLLKVEELKIFGEVLEPFLS